ncbi:MAG TPA: hydrogenase maturation nickel metallochaperone HypA [Candidatus Manganitrophaceae bacterium]
MHETGLMADLIRKIESIARERSARKIVGVKVKIGLFSGVDPEIFRGHFLFASRGTIAEGARLIFELTPNLEDPNGDAVILESLEATE